MKAGLAEQAAGWNEATRRLNAHLLGNATPDTHSPVKVAQNAGKQAKQRIRQSRDEKELHALDEFCLYGIIRPQCEYRFASPRRWRFDYAWPAHMIALEVEGGIWTGGRHTRGAGFLGDMEKYNAAAVMGWRVLRCTPSTLKSNETIEMLRKILP